MDTNKVSGMVPQPDKSQKASGSASAIQSQPDFNGQSIRDIIPPSQLRQLTVLTPTQAAELLQISTKTLIKMAKAGSIPSFRACDLWRFSAVALENWLIGSSLPQAA